VQLVPSKVKAGFTRCTFWHKNKAIKIYQYTKHGITDYSNAEGTRHSTLYSINDGLNITYALMRK